MTLQDYFKEKELHGFDIDLARHIISVPIKYMGVVFHEAGGCPYYETYRISLFATRCLVEYEKHKRGSEFIGFIVDCETKQIVEILDEHKEIRRCSICGQPMDEGWTSELMDFYVCSEECLHKFYEGEDEPETQLQSDLDNEYIYYTEWESIYL